MAEVVSNERKLELVREMAQAWADLDWRKVAALFAEDGVLHSMMVDPIQGRDAVYKRVSGMSEGLTQITLNIAHMGVIDGLVFIERTDEFTFRGKQGSVPVVGVLQYEGDLIKVWREYYDRAHLLHALGLDQDFDAATR